MTKRIPVQAFADVHGTLHLKEEDAALVDAIAEVENAATDLAVLMEEHAPYSDDSRTRQCAEVDEFKTVILSILSHRKKELLRLLKAADDLDEARAVKAKGE